MSIPDVEMSVPPLNQIYFYLTEGCNLRCRHCWIMTEPESKPSSARKAFLDLDLFVSILEQARPLGLTAVKLTGGEPFLHPQIKDMLEVIREGRWRLVVETNGVLVTPELAALMAECHQPFVSVSLDGADRATHEWVRQVPGSFQSALQGLGYLVQAGLNPQVIFTVMQKNQAQVGAVAWLAQDIGAKSVKFNIIQPSPRGDHMRDHGEALSLPEVLELARWVEEDLAPSLDIPLFFSQPPAFNPLKRVFGPNPTRFRCGILGILGVLATGSYALCGIGSHIPELVFGHASRDRLADVWQNSRVLQEIREGLPERLGGICHDCLLKKICMGLCLAQNYYQSRNLWTSYWFCQQAADAGLFPESRVRPAC